MASCYNARGHSSLSFLPKPIKFLHYHAIRYIYLFSFSIGIIHLKVRDTADRLLAAGDGKFCRVRTHLWGRDDSGNPEVAS